MVTEGRKSWRSALKRISSSGMRPLLGDGAPSQRRQAATSAWHRSFEKAACGTELLWLRILRSKTASAAAPSGGPSLERPSTRSGRSGRLRTSDRKSTRLNSSHDQISYAVFCLKKKKTINEHNQ